MMAHPPVPPMVKALRDDVFQFEPVEGIHERYFINATVARLALAAVCEVQWRKEADQLMDLHKSCECSRCCDEIYNAWNRHNQHVQPALDNAIAWRVWGATQ